jgi:hypothetical protein
MSRFLLSEHDQGTEAWKLARAGKATGSRAADIRATLKSGGEAACRRDYKTQLVVERLTNAPAEDGYVSKEMQRGIEMEPFARMAYEAQTGRIVREAGFVYLPDVPAGCSVDGFIDEGGRLGILECKCPKTATHVTYLLNDRVPPEYIDQITHNLWITGAAFADFVSYDDRVPEELKLFRVRMMCDEAAIAEHEKHVVTFLGEVATLEQQLRARMGKALALAA